ncbi:hypothetical protein FUT79_00810 [Treponema phagedenis]|nr:hypothetical protein FUT79_00810 [Treponema phagedenis]
MVPRRSDVLKQGNLQSFKTRRFGFATDGKNSAPPRTAKTQHRHGRQNQNGHGRPWFQAELSLKTTTAI